MNRILFHIWAILTTMFCVCRIILKMLAMCGHCVEIKAYWITGQHGECLNLGFKTAAHGFDKPLPWFSIVHKHKHKYRVKNVHTRVTYITRRHLQEQNCEI